MEYYYVGLDVSMKKTYIVITDTSGRIIRQKEVKTEIADISSYIGERQNIKLCLESGSISHWLARGLSNAGFDVVVADARHMERYLSSRTNKNDKNDAIGIAEALRAGLIKEVAVKSKEAQAQQVLLSSRRQLVQTGRTLSNSIRGQLKSIGIRFCQSLSVRRLIAEVENVINEFDEVSRHAISGLCEALKSVDQQMRHLHNRLVDVSKQDNSCKLLQTIPGVGPVTALTYLSTIDDHTRFNNSRVVGAYVGLAPKQYASGDVNRIGCISRRGSGECRSMLYEAALCLITRCKKASNLRSWGRKIMNKKGTKRAAIAVARKLAVIMHSMLVTGELFNTGVSAEV